MGFLVQLFGAVVEILQSFGWIDEKVFGRISGKGPIK